MNKLNKAIILSAKIHSGKKGRNNEPAVLHPIRIMIEMKSNKPQKRIIKKKRCAYFSWYCFGRVF